MPTRLALGVSVSYAPILDVPRGSAAGYQAEVQHAEPRALDVRAPGPLDDDTDGTVSSTTIRLALAASTFLPDDTFLSVPITTTAATSTAVRRTLAGQDLTGVVLDLVTFSGADTSVELGDALAEYRAAGATLAVGGRGVAQPELASIVRLKPAILRLGRDWIRDVERSDAKRSALEVIGRLAAQFDARVLAEGVSTAAELQALVDLGVPLAQGPLIGPARSVWPAIELDAHTSLHTLSTRPHGALRALVQRAHTATDPVAAAAVLPEASGVDVVVVLDERQRPVSLLEQDGTRRWAASEVLSVDVDLPLRDAVARAMVRPRASRFAPLACTDTSGRFVGIVRIERLVAYLAAADASGIAETAAAG